MFRIKYDKTLGGNMEFNKKEWDKAHYSTVQEEHPDWSEEKVKEFVENESKSEDWLAYEDAFRKMLVTYTKEELCKMFYESKSPEDFNRKFFKIDGE